MDEDRAREIIKRVQKEPCKQVICQESVIEKATVGLFSSIVYARDNWVDVGKCYIIFNEVPGTGKTVLARRLADSINAKSSFIACHPEMKHSDLFGGDMLKKQTGEFFHYR